MKIPSIPRLPAHILLKKGWEKLREKLQEPKLRKQHTQQTLRYDPPSAIEFSSFVRVSDIPTERFNDEQYQLLQQFFLDHRYDLLGSGWVSMDYGTEALGVEGHHYPAGLGISTFDQGGEWLQQVVLPSHLNHARTIWRLIKEHAPYRPIDWQRDFKSGYRFSAQEWYRDQGAMAAANAGVDLKVPWELSRFQHLPLMGLMAAGMEDSIDPITLVNPREALIAEFRNQVVDFIATNPPNMGVNWTTSMDVGIRIANLLVAYDIFCQIDRGGHHMDSDFNRLMHYTTLMHGRHLAENLEYKSGLGNNHYLANLVGLLFAGAYLPPSEETDSWIAFAIQEWLHESKRQFPFGENFECSTCYHVLGMELWLYSTALVIGLSVERRQSVAEQASRGWSHKPALKPLHGFGPEQDIPFDGEYMQDLLQGIRMVEDLIKPDGSFPQFGDNDSGRLFRFSMNGEILSASGAERRYHNLKGYTKRFDPGEPYFDVDDLDRQYLVDAGSGLFDGVGTAVEAGIVTNMTGGIIARRNPAPQFDPWEYPVPELDHSQSTRIEFTRGVDLGQIKFQTYLMHFGLAIYKSDEFYLAVYFGTDKGRVFSLGHAHNDLLSFELMAPGVQIRDPGTYLYTCVPEQRDRFRSALVHHGPEPEPFHEPRTWPGGRTGLFLMNDEAQCEYMSCKPHGLIIRMKNHNREHVREFRITAQALEIIDSSNQPFKFDVEKSVPFSSGYGKLLNE